MLSFCQNLKSLPLCAPKHLSLYRESGKESRYKEDQRKSNESGNYYQRNKRPCKPLVMDTSEYTRETIDRRHVGCLAEPKKTGVLNIGAHGAGS